MKEIPETQFAVWCRRLRASDRTAFDALFRAMYPGLLAYAQRIVGSEAAAQDVVQDAFLRVWSRRHTLDAERSLRALLYVTVRHLALNALAKDERSQQLEPVMEKAHEAGLDEAAATEDLAARFRTWIEALPEKRREAFQLSRFSGLTYAEIGQIMDISVRTVENHIRLALQDLRDCLQEHEPRLLKP